MTDVKYGVAIGDLTMSASECVRLGPKVEGWGFDSIWMCDHLIDLDGAIRIRNTMLLMRNVLCMTS